MSRGMTPVEVIVNRILVVDPNRAEAEFLQNVLQQNRYHVELARDAGQARAAFTMHMPDCVIMEAILPNDFSGFELCDRMKRDNDAVPVVMLTEIDMEDARNLASRVGVDAYLTKPYDPKELLAAIRVTAERLWAKKHLGDDVPVSDDRIRFSCGECGKHMKARASHRGRTLNCPQCGEAVMVPLYD